MEKHLPLHFHLRKEDVTKSRRRRESKKVTSRIKADVAKLVDALDLGSSAARHGGSSPSIRTKL